MFNAQSHGQQANPFQGVSAQGFRNQVAKRQAVDRAVGGPPRGTQPSPGASSHPQTAAAQMAQPAVSPAPGFGQMTSGLIQAMQRMPGGPVSGRAVPRMVEPEGLPPGPPVPGAKLAGFRGDPQAHGSTPDIRALMAALSSMRGLF